MLAEGVIFGPFIMTAGILASKLLAVYLIRCKFH